MTLTPVYVGRKITFELNNTHNGKAFSHVNITINIQSKICQNSYKIRSKLSKKNTKVRLKFGSEASVIFSKNKPVFTSVLSCVI